MDPRNRRSLVFFHCVNSRNRRSLVFSRCGNSRNQRSLVLSHSGNSRNRRSLVFFHCGKARGQGWPVLPHGGTCHQSQSLGYFIRCLTGERGCAGSGPISPLCKGYLRRLSIRSRLRSGDPDHFSRGFTELPDGSDPDATGDGDWLLSFRYARRIRKSLLKATILYTVRMGGIFRTAGTYSTFRAGFSL